MESAPRRSALTTPTSSSRGTATRSAPRGLANRDRTVGGRMEVSALLWLVELGPDRVRRPVPPESPEHVGGSRGLVSPARRDEMPESRAVEVSLHLKAIAAIPRHCLV